MEDGDDFNLSSGETVPRLPLPTSEVDSNSPSTIAKPYCSPEDISADLEFSSSPAAASDYENSDARKVNGGNYGDNSSQSEGELSDDQRADESSEEDSDSSESSKSEGYGDKDDSGSASDATSPEENLILKELEQSPTEEPNAFVDYIPKAKNNEESRGFRDSPDDTREETNSLNAVDEGLSKDSEGGKVDSSEAAEIDSPSEESFDSSEPVLQEEGGVGSQKDSSIELSLNKTDLQKETGNDSQKDSFMSLLERASQRGEVEKSSDSELSSLEKPHEERIKRLRDSPETLLQNKVKRIKDSELSDEESIPQEETEGCSEQSPKSVTNKNENLPQDNPKSSTPSPLSPSQSEESSSFDPEKPQPALVPNTESSDSVASSDNKEEFKSCSHKSDSSHQEALEAKTEQSKVSDFSGAEETSESQAEESTDKEEKAASASQKRITTANETTAHLDDLSIFPLTPSESDKTKNDSKESQEEEEDAKNSSFSDPLDDSFEGGDPGFKGFPCSPNLKEQSPKKETITRSKSGAPKSPTPSQRLENFLQNKDITITKIPISDSPPQKTKSGVKRKAEDKSSDPESTNEKFPIQYKGFKKKIVEVKIPKSDNKKVPFKGNPFNPLCKRDPKSKLVANRGAVSFDDNDPNSLHSEYAQYLGLQPIVKFRCPNCTSACFQSMAALNTHLGSCKKSNNKPNNSASTVCPSDSFEPKSTNIKFTRKVFLCSTCGTYYENWNLFLHMREVHNRFICLLCLGMFHVSECLYKHLTEKHKVVLKKYMSLESFQKDAHPEFFLLCLTCDRVFSEVDNFYDHECKKAITSKDEKEPQVELENKASTNSQEAAKLPSQDDKAPVKEKPATHEPPPAETAKESKVLSPIREEEEEGPTTPVPQENVPPLTKQETPQEAPTQETPSLPQTDKKETPAQPEISENSFMADFNTSSQESGKSESQPAPKPMDVGDDATQDVAPTQQPEAVKVNSIPPTKDTPLPPKSAKKKVIKSGKIKKTLKGKKKGAVRVKKILNNIENVLSPHSSLPPSSSPSKQELPIAPLQEQSEPEMPIIAEPPIVTSHYIPKIESHKDIFRIKLQSTVESDIESDDSQKLSLVVDENASVSDSEKKTDFNSQGSTHSEELSLPASELNFHELKKTDEIKSDVALASEDVPAMALTLDDKIENVPIQNVIKECVRTSCLSCNYCRHAVKIAVNAKFLSLHLLSEHRYTPVKNETPNDVIKKLKTHLEDIGEIFFNTETYDSTDPSIHVPYDQDSSFDCFQCNYVTSTHRDLFAHKRKSHTKSLLLCIMCKCNFLSYSELLCHLCPGHYNNLDLHMNLDIKFRCCFCRLDNIPSAFRLMVHLRKSHHTCDICLEMCSDQQKLSTHMWKHKLNHLCYRCGIAYASKPDITKHLFWKHGTESVVCKKCLQKKWPHVYHFCIPPASFICEECNTSFSKAVALKVHKRIHTEDLPYPCTKCEKRFVSKKLCLRHEDRHNYKPPINEGQITKINSHSDSDQKDEIINVTDLPNESKDSECGLDSDNNKENDGKEKCHKKHKKEKDKKVKPVVDVYDLPPLNLSSESDSSDDEKSQAPKPPPQNLPNDVNPENANRPVALTTEKSEGDLKNIQALSVSKPSDIADLFNETDKTSNNPTNPKSEQKSLADEIINNPSDTSNAPPPAKSEQLPNFDLPDLGSNIPNNPTLDMPDILGESTNPSKVPSTVAGKGGDPSVKEEENASGIWENFYKTTSQNTSLPYPLCAMKSEVAYGIIMGDHDYCIPTRGIPIIREDIPSTSNLDPPAPSTPPATIEIIAELDEPVLSAESPIKREVTPPPAPPAASPEKKKMKSPKKKTPMKSGNNSSSSSDSSSDTDSSSCSCGTNCSCSSSSSNSSSSSSSDSDSSSTEDRTKQEKRKKKKERKSKTKPGSPSHASKDTNSEAKPAVPIIPVDPPIQESELETDETSTDEEFYDKQPQRKANELLAEKRNQLMLLASVVPPLNNGTGSPTGIATPTPEPQPIPSTPQPAPVSAPSTPTLPPISVSPKSKQKTRRKKKLPVKPKSVLEKSLQRSSPSFRQSPSFLNDLPPTNSPGLHTTPTLTFKQDPLRNLPSSHHRSMTPLGMENAGGSGSETDNTRSSKRRRIPNKFYGYSSGDEEDVKPTPLKWRKQEPPHQPPPPPPPPVHHSKPTYQPYISTPTPRIQLTVPKQIIRKSSYKPPKHKVQQQSSSNDSSDSGSEVDNRTIHPAYSAPPPPVIPPPVPDPPQKADKDVYCFCRCPYDEVSEMIACDDSNCKIEWFHFECVGILVPPRGQWFCPDCRKARGLP